MKLFFRNVRCGKVQCEGANLTAKPFNGTIDTVTSSDYVCKYVYILYTYIIPQIKIDPWIDQ